MKLEPIKDVSNIKIEADGDIIFTTVGKYKLFYSYGSIGMDAYLLYSHLQFTARLQGTNSVGANNKYLRQGLSWGKDRLQKAKNLLNDLGIIENIVRKRENGTISGHYIVVKTTTKVGLEPSSDPEIHPVDSPDGGSQEPNALTNNRNALTNKPNAYPQSKKVLTVKCELFEKWYDLYDKKVSRANAEKLWNKLSSADKDSCLNVVNAYVASTPDKQYRKQPDTYLRNNCWEDEIIVRKTEKTTAAAEYLSKIM